MCFMCYIIWGITRLPPLMGVNLCVNIRKKSNNNNNNLYLLDQTYINYYTSYKAHNYHLAIEECYKQQEHFIINN